MLEYLKHTTAWQLHFNERNINLNTGQMLGHLIDVPGLGNNLEPS